MSAETIKSLREQVQKLEADLSIEWQESAHLKAEVEKLRKHHVKPGWKYCRTCGGAS